MATIAPPSIVINDPGSSSPSQLASNNTPARPSPTALDTTPSTSNATTPTQATYNTTSATPLAPLLKRTNSLTTTTPKSAACYLCDEQNPGDFSPTTNQLSSCLLCSRYFCRIHQHPTYMATDTKICNINHSTYYHEMLVKANSLLSDDQTEVQSPNGWSGAKRELAEMLTQEGIYPSLGEREKAIFATSPVDEQKEKELKIWRSLDAAVANGGERGKKVEVEEKDVLGADIAI